MIYFAWWLETPPRRYDMPREEIIEQLDRVMRETDWERARETLQAMREARRGDDGEDS
jgi:hypothetical protein